MGWQLRSLGGLDDWLALGEGTDDDRRYVYAWVMDLEKDPRPVESVALPMDPNDMRPERRVARLPEVEDVVVIYTLDPILGEIDIDDVGNDYLYPPKG